MLDSLCLRYFNIQKWIVAYHITHEYFRFLRDLMDFVNGKIPQIRQKPDIVENNKLILNFFVELHIIVVVPTV